MKKIVLGAAVTFSLVFASMVVSAIGYFMPDLTTALGVDIALSSLTGQFLNGLVWIGALALFVSVLYCIGYLVEKIDMRKRRPQ
ncbi:MAG: hypothetical protein Q7S78_01700 [Candidatus Azambacteria bacterium]|nr:hypothetical protein [Candidatus Azambacteria bacterium]